MGWVTKCLLAIMAACVLATLLDTSSAECDVSDLTKLVSDNEDTHMNSQDLAFFLVTHNYNAFPKDGYVELNLNGAIYRLIPNNSKPRLCDMD